MSGEKLGLRYCNCPGFCCSSGFTIAGLSLMPNPYDTSFEMRSSFCCFVYDSAVALFCFDGTVECIPGFQNITQRLEH